MKKAMFILLVSFFAFASCEEFAEAFRDPDVEYYVNASDEVFITISGEGESTEQFTVSSLPWSKKFTAGRGNFVYVSAQVNSYDGWVETRIDVNGDTIDEARSQGDFVIATSSGSAE